MGIDIEELYLGFDPGGDSKFGVAALDGDCMKTCTVSTVDDAIDWAKAVCGARYPVAAGIDTLLHWATAKSGFRPCDLNLRRKYGRIKNSIMSPNSLYGAMAIGGMALALRLQTIWPELVLNETHPKILLHAHWDKRYDPKDRKSIEEVIRWFVMQGRYVRPNIKSEHELDAALSAWATQEGLAQQWTNIIGDEENLLFPAGTVRYLWPETLG